MATFTATRYYHVSFLDYDNTSLSETTALEGNVPEYPGSNPTRDEDDYYSYEFNGWLPELTPLSS